ncbi:winged helix-turn-helix domain-containing protein [Terribacillus sp. DMT04]|uniref:ArsR/SmtB family transcription factor n=1 Tax=Terribacillus sp. DMT04 TaxID=2850441 RepID=UPI001C2B87C3|nr:winged helix-turn-helix domain-containing protein [Terribacillus sp. DMT04]QXE02183.1 winged helix-turn-helix domain-containing protein [Terribacillus sp. DMT04]
MKQVLALTTYEQLKAISDPLRAEIIMKLVETSYTGQQLAALLEISRPKIHYHLKELEKNSLIEVIRTEEKNGIMQKFYRATARGFYPSEDLLPYAEALSESTRQLFVQMANKTKTAILSAPESAFAKAAGSTDPKDWEAIGSIWEISATEADFKAFTQGLFDLMQELRQKSDAAEKDPNGKLYYFSAFGFEIDEPSFDQVDLNGEE